MGHPNLKGKRADGALYTARQGGRKLLPIAENPFLINGRMIEHDFGPTPQSGYTAWSLTPGQHPVAFEWQAPVVVTASSLAEYTGSYFSPDLNVVYNVSATDSTLTLKTGTSNALIARPVFGDTFVIGKLTLQFTRTSNEVTAFQLSHPRARRLLFIRASKP